MPKLTTDQWAEIRRAYEAGVSQGSLAKQYGVSITAIRAHKASDGWLRVDTEEPVTVGHVDPEVVVSMPEPVDETALLAARVAELESELAAFKPVHVEWPVDEKTAARMLATQLDEMIEGELEQLNMERMKRGHPPMTVQAMAAAQPDWYERQKTRIIRETVEALTKYASDTGPATRTLAMIKPDGHTIVKVPLSAGIGNYGLSPDAYMARLKKKGYKEVEPRACLRQDCWALAKTEWSGYCGELHFSLDPFAGREQPVTLATTTRSFA